VMQGQRRWLALLTGDDGAVILHLVFVVNNSLSDDLIAARWAEQPRRGLHMSARGPLLLGPQAAG